MFVIGPKASGKTQVGSNIAERTNMNLINFKIIVILCIFFLKRRDLFLLECATQSEVRNFESVLYNK